jgi:ABC-type lipoprotein release transport system permease subunit
VVSSGLAAALGVRPGDRVRLVAEAADGTHRELAADVGGVLAAGLDELDDAAVYLPLAAAGELGSGPGAVHELAVVLASADRGAARAARERILRLTADRPELAVSTWEETLPMLRDAIVLDVLTHRVFIAVVYLIVGIGVVTTLALSVLERTRELGLLLALGAPPALLRRLVLAEAALVGAGSVLLGLACASALTAALARWGLDLRPFLREEIAYGGALFSLRLHAGWDWAETARAAAALLLVHVAAAAWPASRATGLRPAEALRFR